MSDFLEIVQIVICFIQCLLNLMHKQRIILSSHTDGVELCLCAFRPELVPVEKETDVISGQ